MTSLPPDATAIVVGVLGIGAADRLLLIIREGTHGIEEERFARRWRPWLDQGEPVDSRSLEGWRANCQGRPLGRATGTRACKGGPGRVCGNRVGDRRAHAVQGGLAQSIQSRSVGTGSISAWRELSLCLQ